MFHPGNYIANNVHMYVHTERVTYFLQICGSKLRKKTKAAI